MTVNIESELYRAAASTFEDLGLMFLDTNTDGERSHAEPEVVVSVNFNGPMNGALFLAAYGDLLPTLVSNMLGEDGSFSKRHHCDALGEIANVICGNLLPIIADRVSVFRITAPRVVEAEEWMRCAVEPKTAEVEIALEEGRAHLILFVETSI